MDGVEERWLPAPGFDGCYVISDLGRFKSINRVVIRSNGIPHTVRGGLVKARKDSAGYLQAVGTIAGERRCFMLHRVVALAFLGEPPPGRPEVNHMNADKEDCRACNLEWCSRSENLLHAANLGLIPLGQSHSSAALTYAEVGEIRLLLSQGGLSQRAIARQYGVSHQTVGCIARKQSWKQC